MILALLLGLALGQDRCTYRYTVWDTNRNTSVEAPPVDKPYDQLTANERGPMGCTPCTEDQRTVALANGLELTACHALIERAAKALDRAIEAGAEVVSISGYRPVMSKGPVDREGRRTELSRHAFGLAIDVNREHNGLYGNCPSWGRGCTLLQGGPYRPGSDPRSLVADHPVVTGMIEIGLRWGGAISGAQKDYMHFSPDGY